MIEDGKKEFESFLSTLPVDKKLATLNSAVFETEKKIKEMDDQIARYQATSDRLLFKSEQVEHLAYLNELILKACI